MLLCALDCYFTLIFAANCHFIPAELFFVFHLFTWLLKFVLRTCIYIIIFSHFIYYTYFFFRYEAKLRLMEEMWKDQSIFKKFEGWEIARSKVVINRKLGEGQFGTVYGGECLMEPAGWVWLQNLEFLFNVLTVIFIYLYIFLKFR